jgi:hypothetical protein
MTIASSPVAEWRDRALSDPDGFWGEAADQVHWFRRWDRVFEQPDPPSFRWFSGGRTNLAYSALDAHVAAARGNARALIYANERGERRTFTYAALLAEVERAASALRALGVDRGDRVTIYMPTCPEAIIAMLATVRIGAITRSCSPDSATARSRTVSQPPGHALSSPRMSPTGRAARSRSSRSWMPRSRIRTRSSTSSSSSGGPALPRSPDRAT